MPPRPLPPPVRRGDRVALVAPSGPVDPGRVARGMAWLRSVGLEPVPGEHLAASGGHGLPFLAGDDLARARDLQHAWSDPSVTAVLCARGGAGASRLPDLLDWPAMRAVPPKAFAGMSDATALHQAIGQRLDVATLWSPMPATTVLAGPGADPWSRRGLAAALTAPEASVVLAGDRALGRGRARGPLAGGTLSLVAAAAGTPEYRPAAGALALLEDVGEAPYRVERLLTQLRRAGWFEGVVGVACGDWPACGDPGELAAVLADRLGDLGVPVLLGLPFGHGPRQASLWLGRPATLDADAGTLTQLPAAC